MFSTQHWSNFNAMNNSPAIAFENIEKSYGDLQVLRGISGNVSASEVVAVIGTSGCGKSTLLRCLNRLELINRGQITINGMELSNHLSHHRLRDLRSQVGMVFQQFNLFPHLTVLENLTLAPQQVLKRSRRESEDRGRYYLEQVGLADKADRYPEQLSGGQQQRVAIARSLCMEPQIMLFDDARDVAHRVMFLDQGIVVEEGEARQVLTHPKSDRLTTFLSRMRRSQLAIS
jgi:arginine/lysine/histidine/glutamine transport system ATP-binding protein